MKKSIHTFIKNIQRFRASQSAVAAVEFALILPVLLLLYLGIVEASRAISYDKRVVTSTSAMGDLVARSQGSISIAQLNDFFEAARIIIAPYSAASLSQVVTSVYVDDDGDTSVRWSRGYNGGVVHAVGDTYELPEELTDVTRDGFVIVSEASLDYDPITTYIFPSSMQFYKEFFHLPRYGTEIVLN